MGQVVIKFIGLCIHVRRSELTPIASPHRVILLSNEEEEIQHHRIEAHTPILQFVGAPRDIKLPCVDSLGEGKFLLNGVGMRISNAKGGPAAHENAFARVPHLTWPGAELPDPRMNVIANGEEPVGAYFDVDHGTFFPCLATAGGALGTSLVIYTGDEEPLLDLWCLRDVEPVHLSVPLGNDARLHLTNVAGAGDDVWDYLLNYKILDSIPLDPPTPNPDITGLGWCIPDIGLDFGPPCSNSNYP